MLGGFGLTRLVVDSYVPFPERDDRALLATMAAMRTRLTISILVPHPVLTEEFICAPARDAPARFMRGCLEDALEKVRPLTEGCPRPAALSAWGTLLNTDFFGSRPLVRWV